MPQAPRNPKGTNQFGGFSDKPEHGDVKLLEQNENAAKLAGEPNSALNAPRRSQRRATSGGGPEGTPRVEVETPAQPLPHEDRTRAFWEEVASHPDASPLAREYAKRARGDVA